MLIAQVWNNLTRGWSFEFTERYAAHQDWLKSNEKAGQRFVAVEGEKMPRDLCFANFSKAVLRNADLSNSVLKFTKLDGADLNGADLREAWLFKTGVCGAYMTRSTMLPDGEHYTREAFTPRGSLAYPAVRAQFRA